MILLTKRQDTVDEDHFICFVGVVAFLEEDHYVTPDFLWVLNLMETAMIRNLCQGCNLVALGTYLKTWNIRSAHNQVSFHVRRKRERKVLASSAHLIKGKSELTCGCKWIIKNDSGVESN